MKLYIDDCRPTPSGFIRAFNYNEAIIALSELFPDHISFDHDLGEEKTGYDIAKWIEQRAAKGLIGPITYEIHSANPVGRRNIEMAMKSAERFWCST